MAVSVSEDCLTLDVVVPVSVWEKKEVSKGMSFNLTDEKPYGRMLIFTETQPLSLHGFMAGDL